jgi:hypothetical protein
MLLRRKPAPKPLAELMACARDYAEFAMRNIGHVPPTMFAATRDGLLHFVPESLQDEKAKTDFANAGRMICAAYDATAAVTVLESWMTFAKPGEPLDDTPPSESFDRKEFVVIIGDARDARTHSFLPIIRTDAGGFFGFGEFGAPDVDGFSGRFGQMLPPKVPTKEMRAVAQAVLEVMGLTRESLLYDPKTTK